MRRKLPAKKLLSLGVGVALTTPLCTLAQEREPYDALALEEVIVTGVGGGNPLTKLESSVAITTKSAADIDQKAPLNLVDLISVVPGFWAESSGGESGAGNVFIRGLPQDGGFIFMQQLEDGLPVLNEPSVNFLPVDGFAKVDATVSRFEAVRGGSAAVFATGAPGGMINLVTQEPSDTPESQIKVQLGDYNHIRTDFVHTGPLSDEWNMLVGGFYRQDDGVREPGFTANKGYQFRVRAARDIDSGRLWFDVKKIDDSGIFYLPIGVSNPNPTGGAFSDEPNSIPGTDASEFTATSADFQRVLLRHPNGVNDRSPDMADGIGADTTQFTAAIELELADGWLLDGKARYTSGDFSFISGISIGQPTSARELVDDLVARAQALGASADPRYNGSNGIDLSQAADAVIRYTNSGEAFDIANQNGNGLVYETGFWDVRWDVENVVTDWRLSKSFDSHDITFGFYFGSMETTNLKDWANVLHDLKDGTELVDITFVDASGAALLDAEGNPVQRTENGVWRYGVNYEQSTDEMTTLALYVYDEWQVNDVFRLDFGFRWDQNDYKGSFGVSPGSQDFDGNAIDSLFLARDGVTVAIPDRFDDYDRSLREISYTVGANWTLTDDQALFGRFSVGYDFPKAVDTIRVVVPATGKLVEASKVTQLEVGYKLSLEDWSVFASAFSSEVEDQIFNDNVVLSDGTQTQLNLLYGTETFGVEAEVVWNPTDNVQVSATATYQEPEYEDFGTLTGNQVRRIPETIFSITPTYRFGDDSGYVYFTYFNGGDRFADFANNLELPGYETIDAGVSYNLSENFSVRLQGFNLTDEVGLTEGNPRGNGTEFGNLFTARPILGRHYRASVTWDF
ncbi:TonB-dependent receptor [Exilibacterium tricleocarpae]|uniref:TonB-dependent receptor n=1 Tax=Exilibacterium tricleocarpae TaxID=2591008 RepID=A0A545TAL9_9GAMM|nr:TonB-dependent receptor [Exilibacterium tricleocarpae]TQV74261.1 TonB-dependent receptor [Exilibacterium tricleocarpae]